MKTINDLRAARKPHKHAHHIAHEKLSRLDKFALLVTQKIGTFGVFLLIVGWSAAWVGWNLLAPAALQFDPAPAFTFWLFISNIIQISLMPLIMVGQNIQSHHAEALAEQTLQLAEQLDRELLFIIELIQKNETP